MEVAVGGCRRHLSVGQVFFEVEMWTIQPAVMRPPRGNVGLSEDCEPLELQNKIEAGMQVRKSETLHSSYKPGV